LEDQLYCLNYEYKVVERRAKYFETDVTQYKDEATQLQNLLEQNTAKEKRMKQKIMELSEINRELKLSSKQSTSSLNELALHLQKMEERVTDATKLVSNKEQQENKVIGELFDTSKEIKNINFNKIKPWLKGLDVAIDELIAKLMNERHGYLAMKNESDDQICQLRNEVNLLNVKLQKEVDKEQELKAMNEQLNLLQNELNEKQAYIVENEKANERLKIRHEDEKIANQKIEQLQIQISSMEQGLAHNLEYGMVTNYIINQLGIQIKQKQAAADSAARELREKFEKELFDGISDLEETIDLLSEENNLLTKKNEELFMKTQESNLDETRERFSEENDLLTMTNEQLLKMTQSSDSDKRIELLSEENNLLTMKNEELLKEAQNVENESVRQDSEKCTILPE